LRLQPSLFEEARTAAKAEGLSLNRLINIALTEKLSALRAGDDLQTAPSMGSDEPPEA
jgi:hypothetical protein